MKNKKKVESELTNLKKQTIKKEKKHKNLTNYKWVLKITVLAFIISFGFSFASEIIIPNVNIIVGILLVIVFIIIGIIFDMIGMSVASADPVPFHSMSSRKVRGAKLAVKLKKNSDKVSSFCNDVIGDICGIVSGSAGAIVSTNLALKFNLNIFFTTLIVMSCISALTIGGKALFKSYAINKSNIILYNFCRFICIFYRKG